MAPDHVPGASGIEPVVEGRLNAGYKECKEIAY